MAEEKQTSTSSGTKRKYSGGVDTTGKARKTEGTSNPTTVQTNKRFHVACSLYARNLKITNPKDPDRIFAEKRVKALNDDLDRNPKSKEMDASAIDGTKSDENSPESDLSSLRSALKIYGLLRPATSTETTSSEADNQKATVATSSVSSNP